MANGHGGKRPNAGRKQGSATTRSQESMALAEEMGVDPVAMLLSLADWAFKEWQLKQSAETANLVRDYAKEAAPYVRPKLSSVEASGPDGGPIAIAPSIHVTIGPGASSEAG